MTTHSNLAHRTQDRALGSAAMRTSFRIARQDDGAVELTVEEIAGEGSPRRIFSACLAVPQPR